MLTIDLLRSMIHNLVTGQWGTCSHSVGTVALAHGANIADRTSPGSFRRILSCWFKTAQIICLLLSLPHLSLTFFYICQYTC